MILQPETMMLTNDDLKKPCAAQHFGTWAIKADWMQDAVNAVRSGAWEPSAGHTASSDDMPPPLYETYDGVAFVSISGPMTKRGSSFGGASTIRTRRALRAAEQDDEVKSILLAIETPGGSVSGTADLADDVKRINDSKPIIAYCQDMCCSAGYWVASQATKIYANRTAMVGCIGTYGVLMDTSKAQEMAGVEYHVISSGGVKGLGADGRVTDELLADRQREISELNQQFLDSVKSGRNFTDQQITSVADGRSHVGEHAVSLGLVDEVATLDVAMQAAIKEHDMNKEQFMQFAAANPEAVAELAKTEIERAMEAGRNEATEALQSEVDAAKAATELAVAEATTKAFDEGTDNERGRVLGLAKVFKDDMGELVAAIESGHDVSKAKAEAFDRLQAKATEYAQADAAAGNTHGEGLDAPVSASPVKDEPTSDPSAIKDPAARADAEWAAMSADEQANYISREVFVAARKRELA